MPNYFEYDTNNESTGSWYETDDETEINEEIYEPEEILVYRSII